MYSCMTYWNSFLVDSRVKIEVIARDDLGLRFEKPGIIDFVALGASLLYVIALVRVKGLLDLLKAIKLCIRFFQ